LDFILQDLFFQDDKNKNRLMLTACFKYFLKRTNYILPTAITLSGFAFAGPASSREIANAFTAPKLFIF
jgi:hypothetical protein